MIDIHFSSERGDWQTPSHLLERVVCCLGAIDLDPCSDSHTAPNVPAARHFTKEDDGLKQDWRGRIFMNPPYGRQAPRWVEKLCSEWEAGRVDAAVALLAARTDTRWFHRMREHPVCFIRGRLTFLGARDPAPFPSMLVYFGAHREGFTRAFSGVGDVYVRTG